LFARAKINGDHFALGYFESKEDAADTERRFKEGIKLEAATAATQRRPVKMSERVGSRT